MAPAADVNPSFRLRAASHLVTGRVTSVEKVSDLQLVVRSQGETKTVDLGDPEEKDGLFYYRFGHQAAPHEEIVLEPKASRHLISPSRLHLLVADDCQLEAAIFTATPGLFVTGDSSLQICSFLKFSVISNCSIMLHIHCPGSVTPPLSGVTIKLEAAALNPAEVTIETDSKGAYSLGPFPR